MTCHHCGRNEATLALRVNPGSDPYEVCDDCWDRIRIGRELPHVAEIPCHLPVPILVPPQGDK